MESQYITIQSKLDRLIVEQTKIKGKTLTILA